jgi:predicted AlkP superfamily phosphohydrolase/phosphomutase
MSVGSHPKVVVIGLDCAEPSLVFKRFRHRLPTLSRLADEGLWGRLRSCDPPITVPAWMSMMSGRDPGVLGVYGFRNRADYSYTRLSLANAASIREPLLWDFLGRAGKQVILLGVPQTYPPRPVNGCMVSCFLTPSADSAWSYPAEVKPELTERFGELLFDVPNFRTDDKSRLRDDLHRMTAQKFAVARHLLTTRPWDFFMLVEMGTDRAHHAFWRYMDPAHPRYLPGNPFESAIEDYYVYLDGFLAEFLGLVPPEAAVLVVSDHGAQAMQGGVCLNQWLIESGYLTIRNPPCEPTALAKLDVDWSRTRAWGDGGYYGRVFLNVRGREPQGIIPPGEYEPFRQRLAHELESIPDPQGRPLGTRALRPEDLYQQCNGVPPDLLVYFGDLKWRSAGTVGHGSIYTQENDTGPDDANHAPDGLFILHGPQIPAGQVERAGILDIAPTLLKLMGVQPPASLQGRELLSQR